MPNVSPSDPSLIQLLTIELLVCSALIVYVDLRYMIIPNAVNLALLAGGITLWIPSGLLDTLIACSTGVAVFTFIWLLRQLHLRMTGRIGLGMGDVKLMAVAAIWLPFSIFPAFVFLASFLALAYAISSIGRDTSWHRRVPFGPFLAGSFAVTWIFQNHFISLLGLS